MFLAYPSQLLVAGNANPTVTRHLLGDKAMRMPMSSLIAIDRLLCFEITRQPRSCPAADATRTGQPLFCGAALAG